MEVYKRDDVVLTLPHGYKRPTADKVPGIKEIKNEKNSVYCYDAKFMFQVKNYYGEYMRNLPLLKTLYEEEVPNLVDDPNYKISTALGCNLFSVGVYNSPSNVTYVVMSSPLYCKNFADYYATIDYNYPLELLLDEDETVEMIKSIKKRAYLNYLNAKKISSENHFLVVRDRTAIFDMMAKIYLNQFSASGGWDENIFNSIFDTFTEDRFYSKDDFERLSIKPRKIVLNNRAVEIPIIERINDNWIFYRHNFEQYKDELIQRSK